MQQPFSKGINTEMLEGTGVGVLGDSLIVYNPQHYCQNVYVDLDGTIKAHKFTSPGLWRFDGQFYYLKDVT